MAGVNSLLNGFKIETVCERLALPLAILGVNSLLNGLKIETAGI